MSNKYLDCTLPNLVELGSGSQDNPYNLKWTWENVDTDNVWYIKGRVFSETPDQIQIKPLEMRAWDNYSPFIIDSDISSTDDFVSEVLLVDGAFGSLENISRADEISRSVLFGNGTVYMQSPASTKIFLFCTFFTSGAGPLTITFEDNGVSKTVGLFSCILNGAQLLCTNSLASLYLENTATDEASLSSLAPTWSGAKIEQISEFDVVPIPFLTLANFILDPRAEKINISFADLIYGGYTNSGLVGDVRHHYNGEFYTGKSGVFGGRRVGRGALWFKNAYYACLDRDYALGNGAGDSVENAWGYTDLSNLFNGNVVIGQKIREGDEFYLDGSYTWGAQLKFPSQRNPTMKFFEYSPLETEYSTLVFKRMHEDNPTKINSSSGRVDFGTNNEFNYLLIRLSKIGNDLRFNKFNHSTFFHEEEIQIPLEFNGSLLGGVNFSRCNFITKTIYMRGEPTSDLSNFSSVFYRCCLYGYDVDKIKIKADQYSSVSPINVLRVIHTASDTVFKNGPIYVNGNVFSEYNLELDEFCTGSEFRGGVWLSYTTDPVVENSIFKGNYDFIGGLKTEVETDFERAGAGAPIPNEGDVHIRDTFGVTDTANLDSPLDQLNLHCDTLHDPDTLDPAGIDQQDSSTFIYNNTPFTGLGNVAGLTSYNGGAAFDFSGIPSSFSEKPQKATFNFSDPDIQAKYVNWTVVRSALGIPSWQKNLTVSQLELAYTYCLNNDNMIGQFALIVVDDLIVPQPTLDPNEAFESHVMFIVENHIQVQNIAPEGFWNCSATSSVNMVVRSGGQLTFGGPVYSDGLFRGYILAEPGSTIIMGQSTSELRNIQGAIHDLSGGSTEWYVNQSGIEITYDNTLMYKISNLNAFLNIGISEDVGKITTIEIEESYFWPSSVDLNEDPTLLDISESLNKNDTNLLKSFPTIFDNIDRDEMIFSDYNNSDNLIIGTETIEDLGAWGSERVPDSVGEFASSTSVIPREYYVDSTKVVDGDGTELDPFQPSQFSDYLSATGSYSIVSGDEIFIYTGSAGYLTPSLSAICEDNTTLNISSWNKNGVYPALLGFNSTVNGGYFLFKKNELVGGGGFGDGFGDGFDTGEGSVVESSPENINIVFKDIGFINLQQNSSVMILRGALKSQIELYNCIVTGNFYFDCGIDRDGLVGDLDQNRIMWYGSTISVRRMPSITGRVFWNDIAAHVENRDNVTPEELFINGLEMNLDESYYTVPAQNKTNDLWGSASAESIPYLVDLDGLGDTFDTDNFLWYYLEMSNTGRGAPTWNQWGINYGMEGFGRVGVGYFSFKDAKRNLYVNFEKGTLGDGSEENPWNRSQFITYFGNSGHSPIETEARRGDTLWCKGVCNVYGEGTFVTYNISTNNIIVRVWDININGVVPVNFSDSSALEKNIVDVDPAIKLGVLTIKDFFFFINNDDLGVVENVADEPDEHSSVLFQNSSIQTPDGKYLYLNRTQENNTFTNIFGSTIKSDIIRTYGNSNAVYFFNTSIDGSWEDLE